MAADGQIVFEITADGKKAIANVKDVTKAIETETKKWDNAVDGSAANMTGSMAKALDINRLKDWGIQAAKALAQFGKEAINAASDLEEVQNVVDVTFGSGASQIEAWSKKAGTQFGLTETQAKKFTSTLGAMMKSAGMDGQEIVDMSTDLAGLTADMASFYNLDFETAFQKIRSGISGETEPLKQLGINMSVANLEAFALSQGLEKTFSDMTQGEQTMLRYQYIMQATADAQGDFARTSDGYANSMRILQTNIENIKTALGKTFIGVVTEASSQLSAFLELLIPEEDTTTVLDDFAAIDLKTEEKLAQISETAEQARLLTDELEAIGGSKSDKAGQKMQKIVAGLSSINFDQGKTQIVKDFISTLADNIEVLAELRGEDAAGAKAWLDGIAESANSLDSEDAAGWKELVETIKTGLPGIENTDFGASFFSALGEGFEGLSGKTSVLDWALSTLGEKTNRTEQEQALWLETCKRLVETIPGLSSIINTETGEIEGGTQAVKDYVDAWEQGQKKLALLGAIEEKKSALSTRFADLPGLELDMAVAKRRARKSFEQLQQIYEDYGLQLGFNQDGKIARNFDAYGLQSSDIDYLNQEIDYYEQLATEAKDATDEYNKQKEALDEAEAALTEYQQTVEEMPGDVEAASGAIEENSDYLNKSAEEWQTLTSAVDEAVKAMADYYQTVRDETAQSVNNTLNGFNEVQTAKEMNEEAVNAAKELREELKETGKYTDAEIEIKVNAKNAQVTIQSLNDGLQSQLDFIKEYKENLQRAKELGVSGDILAELSDGSAESAQKLYALTEAYENWDGETPEDIKQLNELYAELAGEKSSFTDTLTQQKLSVDETYQAMVESAKKAIGEMNLSEEAASAMGDTVEGLATGISEHVDSVSTTVDSILAELNRLSGWGININLGSFGSFGFSAGSVIDGSNAKGLDYVPFDGYLSELHEGEGVLTAEENRVWQKFKSGGESTRNVDYDALGATMRDNVKPGGNVYLDGRVVGSVVSQMQGSQFRSMQRSGFQQ